MGVKRLGVVGSGVMGTGVTELAAAAGYEVVLRSRNREAGRSALGRVEQGLDRQLRRGLLTGDAREHAMARISLAESLDELHDCDLVIESVVEDLAEKRRLFADLDRACGEATLLATNTSALPVIELARQTRRAERVCGIHFFNPAPLMPLVEIVRPVTASEETIDQAVDFALGCGKKAVVVKDRAGFVVNALLFPYLNNAVRLLDAGVAQMADIDEAMKGGCGFPMGPFALLDLIGIDTAVTILQALAQEYGESNYEPVARLRAMAAGGQCGRKSGAGFYTYAGS